MVNDLVTLTEWKWYPNGDTEKSYGITTGKLTTFQSAGRIETEVMWVPKKCAQKGPGGEVIVEAWIARKNGLR